VTPTTLDHTESAFEKLIVFELTGNGGWEEGDPRGYDAHLGLYPQDVVAFVRNTQAKKWDRLVALAGGEAAATASLVKRLAQQLDKHGTVHVLRRGFSERGVCFSLCQLRPAHSIDPATAAAYAANRLRVVRQVRFDPRGGDSVDLVLFVNGVPTATAELKNRWTGQTVEHAIEQYRTSRDPKLTLFARRAFVHFALDAELAYMTTRLAGAETVFLPFNQGSSGAGNPGGKGNPGALDGHPTAYVWREVWDRDRWLELIQKFVHVEGATTVFPRFHQWHVVVQCQAHARVHGAGHNYLIQHSAGSGKTKEIAWLAHELSSLHSNQDEKVFDKVIVITDRRVLDAQLRRQIEQFEQVAGVVRSISEDSAQLRDALLGDQAKVVVTTLQKFPFVLKALDEAGEAGHALKLRRYAVIVDEAHSSQTGESATDLKALLGSVTPEDLDLDEDDGTPAVLLARLAARGKQPNLSFFAFTATPKARTLELFGRRDDAGGDLRAFHTYSMRQAMEEGFIVDVLRNYTTFDQLARLETEADEQLEVPKGKTSSFFSRYVDLHPYVKAQKAAIVLEHFARVVRPLLGGGGKAMVVCASREEAVQWKRALDQEIERHGHPDVKALVAFSGEVTVGNPEDDNVGMKYTEPEMNKLSGRPLPESKLAAEFDKPIYGVLVVAEKYQTGFDQPALCGMYVDKALTGVNAVQTLSRLNRTAPGKEDVYVLDFRNEAEHIRAAFEPFYGQTEATPTDPNVLFDAADAVRGFGVIDDGELEGFRGQWAALSEVDEDRRHAILSTSSQGAYERALGLESDKQRELREALERFTRLYAFMAQVLAYVPAHIEVLFQFARVLLKRLQSIRPEGGVNLSGTVELTHFRLEDLGAESIALSEDEANALSAIGGDGTGGAGAGQIPLGGLAELVETFNARYGAELGDADALKVLEDVRDNVRATHADLEAQVEANSREDFVRHRDDLLIGAALEVTDDRGKQAVLLKALLDDEDFRARAGTLVMGSIYDAYREQSAG